MYALIMAGGGGTRLHPLSQPERPKPFLPLIGGESLLQATVARLAGVTDDITIVTDRRYERLVREQLPGAAVLLEPMARNTAAAIALASLVIDRAPDDVMAVLPADQTIERTDTFAAVLRGAERLATGSFGLTGPLVTLGIAPDRPATEYGYLIPDLDRGADANDLRAYPLLRFEEKPRSARAEELAGQPGVAWNAGIFLWRRRSILAALGRYTGLVQSLGPMVATPQTLERAYESIQKAISIDHAVMESAARDGSVVMAAMAVGWSDIGSWSALLAAIGAVGHGSVLATGDSTDVEMGDLIVRRVEGRLGIIAPPERGSITAMHPIAVLRGAGPDRDRIEALISRCDRPRVRA